jgi:hypothetical protein
MTIHIADKRMKLYARQSFKKKTNNEKYTSY